MTKKTLEQIIEDALKGAPKINGKSIEEIAKETDIDIEDLWRQMPLSDCDRSKKWRPLGPW